MRTATSLRHVPRPRPRRANDGLHVRITRPSRGGYVYRAIPVHELAPLVEANLAQGQSYPDALEQALEAWWHAAVRKRPRRYLA